METAQRQSHRRQAARLSTTVHARRQVKLIRKLQPYASGKTFMQDGHKAHTSKKTKAYLERKEVLYIKDWPAHSSDLNPIEKVWKVLKSRVARRGPWGIKQLKRVIREEWEGLSQDEIDKIVRHFDTAARQCKRRRGNN